MSQVASKQLVSATLRGLAGAGPVAADKMLYSTGVDQFGVADLTAFGRSLVACANAAAVISALALGSLALQNANAAAISGGTISGLSSLAVSGNLSLAGDGRRILADFSNGTLANRTYLQSSVSNGATTVGIIPNGAGTSAFVALYGGTDLTNYSRIFVGMTGTQARINCDAGGSGTVPNLDLQISGATHVRLHSAGRLAVGSDHSTDLGNGYPLQVSNAGTCLVSVSNTTAGTRTLLAADATGSGLSVVGTFPLRFVINGAESARAFSTGNWGFGAASEQVTGFSSSNPYIDVSKASGNATIAMRAYNNGASGAPVLNLGKSRGATVGTLAATSSGDVLGVIAADGVTSGNAWAHVGRIAFIQNGAAGASQVGADIALFVSDGASAAVERFRLFASGRIYAGPSPTDDGLSTLYVNGLTSIAGNLLVPGTARRLLANMSDATPANRFAVQTTVTDGATTFSAVPNGVSPIAQFRAVNSSGYTNGSVITLGISNVSGYLDLGFVGSGSALPLDISINGTSRLRLFTTGRLFVGTSAADDGVNLIQAAGSISVASGSVYKVNNVQVVAARRTGWSTPTGTPTRTAFDTASVTLAQLAERVKALIDDLHATAGHGLIGT